MMKDEHQNIYVISKLEELNVVLTSCKGTSISFRKNIREYMKKNSSFKMVAFTNRILKKNNIELIHLGTYDPANNVDNISNQDESEDSESYSILSSKSNKISSIRLTKAEIQSKVAGMMKINEELGANEIKDDKSINSKNKNANKKKTISN